MQTFIVSSHLYVDQILLHLFASSTSGYFRLWLPDTVQVERRDYLEVIDQIQLLLLATIHVQEVDALLLLVILVLIRLYGDEGSLSLALLH